MSGRSPAAARLLVLAPPQPDEGLSLATPLLGLPIARRIALAASRAGFEAVFEQPPPPGVPLGPLLEGTGAR